MGAEYLIMHNCSVKEQIPPIVLTESIKERNGANTIKEMLVSNGKSIEDAENFEFTFIKQLGDGQQIQETKIIKQVLAETEYLVEHGKACFDCKFSVGRTFGCYNSISYPISAKAEEWLINLAAESHKKGSPYNLMLIFILDQKVSGDDSQHMRKQGNTYFELDKPLELVIKKSFFSKTTINSNQLIDMIIGVQMMKSTHMNYLLMLYGGLFALDEQPKDKPIIYLKEEKQYACLGLELPQNADKSITEFYELFKALFYAFMNQKEVGIYY